MQSEAAQYLAGRQIVRREPLYSANRMARFMGDIPASQVTADHLDELRRRMQTAGLASRTIESTIADIITVVTETTGSSPGRGHRVPLSQPRPTPVPFLSIESCWPHCTPPLQSFIALSYWSGFRQSDSMRWLLEHKAKGIPAVIQATAGKTRKCHMIPMPEWLATILTAGRYRFRTVSDFARRCIRAEIHAACIRSGVEVWTPKHLRQRGVNEWTRANATAGAIVHGSGLGVMVHYLDPLSVLESAAPRVRLPACFGACTETATEDTLLRHFRRLDPAAQGLIAGMSERLAAG